MFKQFFDFEKPVAELEEKIVSLESHNEDGSNTEKIEGLKAKRDKELRAIYDDLSPWQITQVARHKDRPYLLDYVERICDDFVELHGDRKFMDDPAIVGGFCSIDDEPIMLIGQQKGHTTKERVYRNYGMPNPEGYRKAIRLMEMAERFNVPIVTFIDTPGAFPGIGAEERGQSEAIANNLMVMSGLKVPTLSIVIGEGGSGGALAIGVTDRILMMQYSTYSVISPEGCAAILWKDGSKADLAAKALKISAAELTKLGIVDDVVEEPPGGAHRDMDKSAENLKTAIIKHVRQLKALPSDTLLEGRYQKFRKIGVFSEEA